MKNIRTKIAAVVIAASALVAAPVAANAYTPEPAGPTSITVTPGEPVTVSFEDFEPGESVVFTLTGENGAGATLAAVKFAITSSSLEKTADEDGDVSVTVTLPDNATGEYTLTATGAISGAADPVILTASGSALPATGVDAASMAGIWIGGGILLAGGIAVTLVAVRRQRQDV